MKTISDIWFSSKGGTPPEKIGYYKKSDFEWASHVESSWEVIRDEVVAFIQENESRIKPYFNKSMVSKQNKWKALGFLFWGWELKKNSQLCPKTMAILSEVPNLISASISILEPDVSIHEHRGDTNAIIRCHLPLQVPAGLPDVGFQVAGEQRSWEAGKILLFNDADLHRAWNYSNGVRYILLFDVLRDDCVEHKKHLCSKVLAGIFMQSVVQGTPFVKRYPKWIYKVGFGISYSFLRRVRFRSL